MNKVSKKQKIILVILGVFLSLVFLEGGLRAGGFVLSSFQERRNRISIEKKSVYRIMCLGESTTALGDDDSYPSQLEKILNQRKIRINFSVINKGNTLNTWSILWQLEENIEKYKPDMVIVMMGINDEDDIRAFEESDLENNVLFYKKFKLYRFFRILWSHFLVVTRNAMPVRLVEDNEELHVLTNYSEYSENIIEKELLLKEKIAMDSNNDFSLIELAENYIKEHKFKKAQKIIERLSGLTLEKYKLYIELGKQYEFKKEYKKADSVFKKTVESYPESYDGYLELGKFYIRIGVYNKAITPFKKSIKINPQNYDAYLELGNAFCHYFGENTEGERMLQQAIKINSLDYRAYLILGFYYLIEPMQKDKALEMFNKVADLDPMNYEVLMKTGEYLRDPLLKLDKAAEVFEKAIELDPNRDDAYFELMRYYIGKGEREKVAKIFEKVVNLKHFTSHAYIDMAYFFDYLNMPNKAVDVAKKAIQIDPDNEQSFKFLSSHYEKIGNLKLANYYAKEFIEVGFDYRKETINNYKMLKKILSQRGVKLVCVQYPMRSIRELKNIYEDKDNLFFVDNEKVFKEALGGGEYKDYFTDKFAGDFGHCTPKGNKLLAENVAKVLLKEVFNKK
ncbi:MAG: hypothetical protein KAJ14_11610 [Candidatus Omnitrophica bacterium]|nr:hypothetical protein [Candidatus Omnitrophota bacterium]